MDAFSAGKLDADMVTNGDALVMGGNGAKSVMIMLTDYSNGNDIIVGKPGTKSLADLKGRKVGIEVGLVEHLLLINGLQKMKFPRIPSPSSTPNQRDAASAVFGLGRRHRRLAANRRRSDEGDPGAHPLYTSAQQPGLIYDVIAVKPESYAAHKDEWKKLVGVWGQSGKIYRRSEDPPMHSRSWRRAPGSRPRLMASSSRAPSC